MNTTTAFILGISAGLIVGIIVMNVMSKIGLNKNQQKAELVIKEANIEADAVKRQAVLDGRSAAYELKLNAEKEIKKQRQEVTDLENRLVRRDDNLNFREEKLHNKEKQVDDKLNDLNRRTADLDKMQAELQNKIDIQTGVLEKVANLTAAEAKEELFEVVKNQTANEMALYIKEQEEEAKAIAGDKAKNIIGQAIQRYSQKKQLIRLLLL